MTYQYLESGLDWVILENGFKIKQTPYGKTVAIDDADGLHQAIALDIIFSQSRIRGQEFRFLRSLLGISQKHLGKIVGITRGQVAKIEADPHKEISGSVDRALRWFYVAELTGDEDVKALKELAAEIDELEYEVARFREGDHGWQKQAA